MTEAERKMLSATANLVLVLAHQWRERDDLSGDELKELEAAIKRLDPSPLPAIVDAMDDDE